MVVIKTEDLSKVYGKDGNKVIALDNVNIEIEKGEFVAIVGASGSGKSTLLHQVGGVDRPTSGKVIIDNEDIYKLKEEKLAIFRRRKIGFVFQSFNLIPVLSVEENIKMPALLDHQKVDKEYFKDLVKTLGISDRLNHLPSELSGGQQQRVAIARALVNEPEVLLLDEPLGALDLKLRKEMQLELKKIQQELGITFIFVTHDQEEALTMSDTIVVMNKGLIQQKGTPEDIYNEPANAFVADFIGESNILDGVMVEDFKVIFADREFECVDKGFEPNEEIDVVIRPEDFKIVKAEEGMLKGTVKSVIFKGVHYEMVVEENNRTWILHNIKFAEVDSEIGLDIYPEDIHIMKKVR